jgi:CheY-like chemotaxis protein
MTEPKAAAPPASRLNREGSELLANVGHEVLTPLNAVLGMAGLLLETSLTPEQRSYVETIRDSGEALLSVFERALDFSRLEAGKMELEEKPFGVADLVEGVLDELVPHAMEKGLELAYFADPSVPAEARGDAGKLRQILGSLVENAIKFTFHGEVLVTVAAQPGQPKCLLSFAVRDTGIGIPPDRLDGLFQPFSQADASIARRYEGAGLGLVNSRKLAELMGGTIGVESIPGAGSTFRFSVAVKANAAGPAPSLDLAGKPVAAVAGSPALFEVFNHYLRAWQANPVVERSIDEIVRRLELRQTQVAVVDTNVPGLTPHLLRHLRSLGRGEPCPLILVHPPGSRLESLVPRQEQNNVWFLRKPLKPAAMLETLRAAMRGEPLNVPEAGRAVLDGAMGARLPLDILLAEDHPVNQQVTRLMLSRLGYDLHIVSTGKDAVEAVQLRPYDLILMDVQMPEMDGLEASRCIRRLGNRIHQPRISAITTNALQSDREACSAAGMDDFLSKPVRPEDLKAVLERCAASLGKRAYAAFDPSVLRVWQQKTGRDSQAWREILNLYVKEFRTTLQEILQARADGDLVTFRSKSHYLKGSSQIVGAAAVAKLCLDLESAQDLKEPALDSKLAGLQQALEEATRTANTLASRKSAAHRAGAS